MDLTELSRWLNRAGLSAAPCPWLDCISIFVDERYENFDFDVLGPRVRRDLSRVLMDNGLRRRGSRLFEDARGRIELPRAARFLAGDPAEELELVLARPGTAAFATPTQVLLLTLRREGPVLPAAREDDLLALVHEQPANLDKVRDWVFRTDLEPAFWRLRRRLAERQEAGGAQRRQRTFASRLPR